MICGTVCFAANETSQFHFKMYKISIYFHRSYIPKISCWLHSFHYRVSNHRLDFSYALVCKGHACHILFSYIIMESRHETNCWLWLWVYKFDQKWKILKIQKKKNFFSIFFWKIFFIFKNFLDRLVCLIFKKRTILKYLIWFIHSKLSKNLKNFKKIKKIFFLI